MPPSSAFPNLPCSLLYAAGYQNTNINVCLILDAVVWSVVAYFLWKAFVK